MNGFIHAVWSRGSEVDERCQKPRDCPRPHIPHGYSMKEEFPTPLNDSQKPRAHLFQPPHGYSAHEGALRSQNDQYKEPLHHLRSQALQADGFDEESIQVTSKQQRLLPMRLWWKQMPLSPLDKDLSKLFSELLLKIAYLRRESKRMEELAGAAEHNYHKFQKKFEQFQPEDELIRESRRQESASKQSKSSRLWNLKGLKRNAGSASSADVWGPRPQMSSESFKSPMSVVQGELDEMALRDDKERRYVVAHHHSASVDAIPEFQQGQEWDVTNQILRGRELHWVSLGDEDLAEISGSHPVVHGGSWDQGRSNLLEDPCYRRTIQYPSIQQCQYNGDLFSPGSQSDYGTSSKSISHKVFSQYQGLRQLVKEHQNKEQQVFAELQVRSVKTSEIGSDIVVLHEKLRSVLVEANLVVPRMKVPELDTSEVYDRDADSDELCQEILWHHYWQKTNEVEDLKMRFGEALREYEEEDARLRSQILTERTSRKQEIERLSELLRTLEQENAKSSQNGSYVDTAATPPMLDDHVKTVKELLFKFARIYDTTITEAGLSITLPTDDFENYRVIDRMHFARKAHGRKFRAAYLISTSMFRGFEIDGFDTERGYFCPTLDLEESHASCFREFQAFKSIDILSMLPNLEADGGRSRNAHRLLRFLRRKFEAITPLQIQEECWQHDNPFFTNFVPLAAAIWALQRLAMSFEPNARILRVRSGAEYDEQYMSNVVGEDEEEDSVFLSKVGLMVVPGFRVGKIIIKSQVYLQCTNENS